jgi:hypothetical protein
MSHASKFSITFRDKRTLFKAMKVLDLHPENQVWKSYASELSKAIGVNGIPLGKLLTGYENSLNIFFIEENSEFVPHVESAKLSDNEREQLGADLVRKLQQAYTQCALEKIQNSIISSGQSAHITRELLDSITIYTLAIGDGGKKLIVSIDAQGVINESVFGVSGRSCVDLAVMFEDMLTQSVERVWTHEYDEVIEDQIVQVLKLDVI